MLSRLSDKVSEQWGGRCGNWRGCPPVRLASALQPSTNRCWSEGVNWQTPGSLNSAAKKEGLLQGIPTSHFFRCDCFPAWLAIFGIKPKFQRKNHLLFLSPNSRGIKKQFNKMPITQPAHLPHGASTNEQMIHLDELGNDPCDGLFRNNPPLGRRSCQHFHFSRSNQKLLYSVVQGSQPLEDMQCVCMQVFSGLKYSNYSSV